MGSWYHSGCWSGECIVINTRSLCVWAYKWLFDMSRGTASWHFPAQWKCAVTRDIHAVLYFVLVLFMQMVLPSWEGTMKGTWGLAELRCAYVNRHLIYKRCLDQKSHETWTKVKCCRSRNVWPLPCPLFPGIIYFFSQTLILMLRLKTNSFVVVTYRQVTYFMQILHASRS